MFPNNSSVTRPPPSLFPGSGGTPSPAFYQYYEAATTAVVSARPSAFFSVGPGGLVVDFARFARTGREVRVLHARVLLTGCTHFRSLVPRDLRLSQVPREPHCAFAVFSDSGRASVPSLHGTSVLPPAC